MESYAESVDRHQIIVSVDVIGAEAPVLNMPSTYAHYRLGRDVLQRLDPDLRAIAEGHRQLYDIGLHGPDILFYYDALHRNPTSQVGFSTHRLPGRDFFGPTRHALSRMDDRGAGEAYLMGFVCHFALDSTCHPFIEEYIQNNGIAHTKIEGEFDRMLLEMDGKDPVRQSLVSHINPTEENASIIAEFFPTVDSGQVMRALEDMIHYNDLLVCPGKLKRWMVSRTLRKSGNYDDMIGLVLKSVGDPACDASNTRLTELYGESTDLSVSLIRDLHAYLHGESDELCPRFNRTFSVE